MVVDKQKGNPARPVYVVDAANPSNVISHYNNLQTGGSARGII